MQSDAELVNNVLNGNKAAYADLVHRYERPVQAVAVQTLGDLHAAEDVAQDAFVKAYENLAALRNAAVFAPWLLKITRHQARTFARRHSKHRHPEPLENLPAPQRNGQLDEQAKELLTAVMKLPRHERRTIMLRHFDHRTIRDIAQITGRSVGTITKQLSRAHRRLRKQLKELEP